VYKGLCNTILLAGLLVTFGMASIRPKKDELAGKWMLCGDFIEPEQVDVLYLYKFDCGRVHTDCISESITKYSVWTFAEDGTMDLSAYWGGCSEGPMGISSNIFWIKWSGRKNKLMMTSRRKTKLFFDVLNVAEGTLILKKSAPHE
jgi:hypothetical protein